jgi:hypothetical protein
MVTDQRELRPSLARPQLTTVYIAVATLFTALVLLQAAIAGRGWFKDYDLFDLHGLMANVIFIVAIAQLALSYATAGRGPLLYLTAAILILVVVQVGLGMAIEDSANAGAWHVPNGVLIFGLAVGHNTAAFRLRG